jgi:hypothetical protein
MMIAAASQSAAQLRHIWLRDGEPKAHRLAQHSLRQSGFDAPSRELSRDNPEIRKQFQNPTRVDTKGRIKNYRDCATT